MGSQFCPAKSGGVRWFSSLQIYEASMAKQRLLLRRFFYLTFFEIPTFFRELFYLLKLLLEHSCICFFAFKAVFEVEHNIQRIQSFVASNIVKAFLSFTSAYIFVQESIPLGVMGWTVSLTSHGYFRWLFESITIITSYGVFDSDVVFFEFVLLDISNNKCNSRSCVL